MTPLCNILLVFYLTIVWCLIVQGCKIQATVRKQLIYVFGRRLKEGEVYKISFFSVAPSSGSYRAFMHPYKIVFQMTTKLQPCTSSMIPMYGLSFTSIVDVSSRTVEYDFLVGMHLCFSRFTMHSLTFSCLEFVTQSYSLFLFSSLGFGTGNCDVDVIGLVTVVSEEREYVRDGNITRMVVFEITDHR